MEWTWGWGDHFLLVVLMLTFIFSFCRGLRQLRKYPSRCCPHSGACVAGFREVTPARLWGAGGGWKGPSGPHRRARGSALRRPGAGFPVTRLAPEGEPRRAAIPDSLADHPAHFLWNSPITPPASLWLLMGKRLHSRESLALPHFRPLRPELVPESPRFRSTALPGAASLPPAGASSRLSPDAAGAAWPAGRGGESRVGELAVLQTPAPPGSVLTSLFPLPSPHPPPPPLPLCCSLFFTPSLPPRPHHRFPGPRCTHLGLRGRAPPVKPVTRAFPAQRLQMRKPPS